MVVSFYQKVRPDKRVPSYSSTTYILYTSQITKLHGKSLFEGNNVKFVLCLSLKTFFLTDTFPRVRQNKIKLFPFLPNSRLFILNEKARDLYSPEITTLLLMCVLNSAFCHKIKVFNQMLTSLFVCCCLKERENDMFCPYYSQKLCTVVLLSTMKYISSL